MDDPAKRKGRGLGKRPAMFNTSVRLPTEVMDYFNEHHPYSKQAMMREVLIEYVRTKTGKTIQVIEPIIEGAKDDRSSQPITEEKRTPSKDNPYEGLSEDEIDKLVAAQYTRQKWSPV